MSTFHDAKYFPLFSYRSTRFWICILLATGLFATVSMRVDLGMAVVCMVNSSVTEHQKSATSPVNILENPDQCPILTESDQAASAGYNGTLNWTPSMQSLLFSATFYSGLIVIAFSGYIADRVGPKAILLGAALDYVIITMLSPVLSEWSYEAFFIARTIMGFGEGFIFPCMSSMVGKWFAPNEKSTVAAMYTSGNQVAASLTSVIAARLCATSFGWPSIFYLLGVVGVIWCFLWIVVATNSPEENRWISEKEREYLKRIVPRHTHKSQKKFPWRHIVTCVPLYAAVSCQFAYNIQASILQSFLPMFLKEELRMPLQANGIYTTIPFITQLISKNIFGILADYLKRNKFLTHTRSAKVFQSIGSIGSAIAMIALAFIPTCQNAWTAAPILALYGIFFSCGICGFFTSILSIAPAHSGTLASISMIFGTLGNITGPLILSLLNHLEVSSKWPILFGICAIICCSTAIIFVLFGSADVQHWAMPNYGAKVTPSAEPQIIKKEYHNDKY